MYTHPVERRASPSHSPMYAAAPTFFPEGSGLVKPQRNCSKSCTDWKKCNMTNWVAH